MRPPILQEDRQVATNRNDVFRFLVHRGVQLGNPVGARRWVVEAFPGGLSASDRRRLLSGRNYYVYRHSPGYRATLSSAKAAALDEALRELRDDLPFPEAVSAVELALKRANVSSFVASKTFRNWRTRVAEALLVSTYDPTAAPDDPERVVLSRQMQMIGMLERLAAGDFKSTKAVRDFLTYAIVVLPTKAFAAGDESTASQNGASSRRSDRRAAPAASKAEEPVDGDRVLDAIADVQRAVGLVARRHTKADRGSAVEAFAMSKIPASYLTKRTKRVIHDLVPHSARLTLPDVANTLERELGARSSLPEPPAVAAPVLAPEPQPSNGAEAFVSGASSPMAGLSRVPGIADLKVVRKRLLRYQDGEIALIENVMAKETRRRRHRLLHRDTDVTTTQTETEKVSERDTQVAERFELEQESSNTISADSKVEAGITITASYGPYFSATANAGFSSSTAQTHSQRAASKYARDIVDRSATKVRELVQTFQSRIALTETEETNLHGFTNETSEHVVGVYRWVEKVLEAQVFNYGKRLMLEVMVPDPARYYRQRLASVALPGVTRTPPRPLEVKDASAPGGVRPLSPSDINLTNYLAYAAEYGAVDVEPPPPLYRWAVDAWKEEKSSDPYASMSARKEIELESGYVPVFYRAAVLYPKRGLILKPDANAGAGDSSLTVSGEYETSGVISVGGSEQTLGAGGGVVTGSLLASVQAFPAEKIGVAAMVERQTSYACEISVLCSRSAEEWARWQTATYGSILRAFEARRSDYETQVKTAKSEQEQTFAARPSAENEATIRTELKRAALTLLQQQQPPFVPDSIGTDRPPAIDLNASVYGARIQFFEQACEWNQLVYVPYGYYWADTTDWDALADQEDSDEEMREFLRAGWARVVIPVRAAFTSAMCLYLSTGVLWAGDQVPQVDDPLFVSAVQEIQEADGIADGVAEGDPWIVNLPTALTHLQAGPELPVLVQQP
jgi:hypothetical protein